MTYQNKKHDDSVGGLPVDNVDNTISNQDIRHDNASTVNVDAILLRDGDINILTTYSGLGTVHNVAAVHDTLDDVVLEDHAQGIHGEVSDDRRDGSKGVVVWHEDGDVLHLVKVRDHICLHESAGGSGEATLNSSAGEVHGDHKHLVDDVDDAAVELDILEATSANT